MTGGHAGDVTPSEAYEALGSDPGAVLVDCRSRAEWDLVGVPVSGRVLFVEWVSYDGTPNGRFLDELAEELAPDATLYVLCRSGHRSVAAAIAASGAGFRAFNVTDGFEGPVGSSGRRDVAGWKVAGLPWRHA